MDIIADRQKLAGLCRHYKKLNKLSRKCIPLISSLTYAYASVHMLIVVKSCKQVPGSVHRGFICVAFGCIHKDEILEVLQLCSTSGVMKRNKNKNM